MTVIVPLEFQPLRFLVFVEMANNHQGSTANHLVRVPPIMPQRIGLWFAILERQLASADITDDDAKFTTLIGWLETRYLEQIEDIVLNPPATGCYDKLKNELMRILIESDSERVKRLSHYGLLVDPRNRRLFDTTTQLSARR